MLPDWGIAIVAGETDAEAKVEWLSTGRRTPARRRRRFRTELGPSGARRQARPAPRRMADVVQPGDVVMIEPPSVLPKPSHLRRRRRLRARRRHSAALRPTGRRCGRFRLVQGALVSLDPQTGRVLAMVGGWSFEQSQFNRATQANRQPGPASSRSSISTALEKGISPSQRFLDAPIVVDTPEGRWRPGNFEGTFSGPMSAACRAGGVAGTW